MTCRTCLTKSICLRDLESEPFTDCYHELLCERSCGGGHHSYGLQVVFRHLGAARELDKNRRCDVDECDSVVLDCLAKGFQVKRWHYHELNTTMKALVKQCRETWISGCQRKLRVTFDGGGPSCHKCERKAAPQEFCRFAMYNYGLRSVSIAEC